MATVSGPSSGSRLEDQALRFGGRDVRCARANLTAPELRVPVAREPARTSRSTLDAGAPLICPKFGQTGSSELRPVRPPARPSLGSSLERSFPGAAVSDPRSLAAALHPIVLRGVTLANNLVLAPMAGVSNLPFRLIAREAGAALVLHRDGVAPRASCSAARRPAPAAQLAARGAGRLPALRLRARGARRSRAGGSRARARPGSISTSAARSRSSSATAPARRCCATCRARPRSCARCAPASRARVSVKMRHGLGRRLDRRARVRAHRGRRGRGAALGARPHARAAVHGPRRSAGSSATSSRRCPARRCSRTATS